MATTQHYVWAGGHFILLISAMRYILAWAAFKTPSLWWYKASFVGAFVSYTIVCQKSLGSPQPTAAWAKRALADEKCTISHPRAILAHIETCCSVPLSLHHLLPFPRTHIHPHDCDATNSPTWTACYGRRGPNSPPSLEEAPSLGQSQLRLGDEGSGVC